ncbi:MAG: hypothetical protein AAGD04_01645 [Pseudomonadota bacterium]
MSRFTPDQRAILAQMEPSAAQKVIAQAMFAPKPEPKDPRTTAQKNFEFALEQGYSGSFAEFAGAETASNTRALMVGPNDPNRARWGIPDDGKTYEVEIDTRTQRPINFSVPGGAGTNVSVTGSRQETEYDKTRGKAFGELANSLQETGRTAQRTLTALDAMQRGMGDQGFYSGFGSGGVQFAKRAARAVGFDADGIDSMEAFNALSKQAALDVMGGSLGTGFSNADRDFVLDQVPTLANTPEGNALLIEVQRAIAERSREIAKLARDFERENGRIGLDFEDELSAYSEENPLFTEEWWLAAKSRSGQA